MNKFLMFVLLLLSAPAFGQALSGVNGDCQIGGQQALTSGLPSTGTQQIGTANVNAGAGVQASFPQCLVSVYLTGTTNKANIYSNGSLVPTVLSNPFVANVDGSFIFFAAAGCYDVVMSSGAGPALPYTRTLSGVCVGQGTVTIPGGSGTVGACGTPGALAYYSLAGTAITCDPNFVTDGSGNVIATSMTFNGAGAGFVGFVQGTVPPMPVLNTAYLYSDTSIPTTFGTVLPTSPGTTNQVLTITSVVDATHIKTGWAAPPGGACSDCVLTDPAGDQTIIGSHQFINQGLGQTGVDISLFNADVILEAIASSKIAVYAGNQTLTGVGIEGVSQTDGSASTASRGQSGVYGLGAIVNPADSTEVIDGVRGIGFGVPSAGKTLAGVDGVDGNARHSGAGIITYLAALRAFTNVNSGGGTITLGNFGFRVSPQNDVNAGGLNAGIYIDDQGAGSLNYGIFAAGSTHNDLGGGLTKVGSLQTTAVAFASIGTCNSGAEGTMKPITNSNTATWGATISGTGANHVLAYCDGSNWTVAAQ